MAARRINVVSDGDYAPSNDSDWLRRVGPEANDARKKAVTAGRTARWILLLYGVCVILWAASRGFWPSPC